MFRSTNVPFDECSIRRMFHSTNVPFDECSVRRMFHSTNVPFDECSVRRMFHSTNVPSTKVHSTKVFSTKVAYPILYIPHMFKNTVVTVLTGYRITVFNVYLSGFRESYMSLQHKHFRNHGPGHHPGTWP